VEAEQRVRLGLADFQAGDVDEHREQALDLAERAGEGPAERNSAAPLRAFLLERLFKRIHSQATLAK
jgi:hypothetical protein